MQGKSNSCAMHIANHEHIATDADVWKRVLCENGASSARAVGDARYQRQDAYRDRLFGINALAVPR